jgi:hypothetical protein
MRTYNNIQVYLYLSTEQSDRSLPNLDNLIKSQSRYLSGKGKGKGKVKLSLCLTKHHAMKTNWGSGGIAPRILDH